MLSSGGAGIKWLLLHCCNPICWYWGIMHDAEGIRIMTVAAVKANGCTTVHPACR
jgi:hypothetical protein